MLLKFSGQLFEHFPKNKLRTLLGDTHLYKIWMFHFLQNIHRIFLVYAYSSILICKSSEIFDLDKFLGCSNFREFVTIFSFTVLVLFYNVSCYSLWCRSSPNGWNWEPTSLADVKWQLKQSLKLFSKFQGCFTKR